MILKRPENAEPPLGGLLHVADPLQGFGGGKGRIVPQRPLRICFRRSSVLGSSFFPILLTHPSIIPLKLSRNTHKVSDKPDLTESFRQADDRWRDCRWEGDKR